jgi:uncharacterized Zn-binding protein involved in type VI secretion
VERAFIKQGDRTTVGGVVIEGMEDMEHEGRCLSFLYAKVWCPVCKTDGRIFPRDGLSREDFRMMGREPALEFDICQCKCDPKPLVLASQHDMTM